MDKLQILRKEIDKIDNELIEILYQRFSLVAKVGEIKKILNLPPLDQKRFNQVLEGVKAKAKSKGLSEDLIEEIYTVIHKFALIQEQKIKDSNEK